VYAVLFDIDGTLVQTGGAGQLAFAETFLHEFGVAEISAAVAFAGRSDRAIASELMSVHGVEPSDANWQRFRTAYLGRLRGALQRREGRVLPGVVELLDELGRVPHAAVGLLTGNVRDGAQEKLSFYGLANRFAFGGFGDETKDRCEIASFALSAAEQHAIGRNGAHVQPPLFGAMVIGDTVHDITCARAIGALAVAVPTGGATRDALAAAAPDLLLENLSDSQPLLTILHQALAA
jgi:phosphoglycolate phosphatase-like HAD superfamily hydrolase